MDLCVSENRKTKSRKKREKDKKITACENIGGYSFLLYFSVLGNILSKTVVDIDRREKDSTSQFAASNPHFLEII